MNTFFIIEGVLIWTSLGICVFFELSQHNTRKVSLIGKILCGPAIWIIEAISEK